MERDVGKESHLLASRDTRMLDVGHGGAGRESAVVVAEGEVVALGGTLESEASAQWSARTVPREISGPQS